MKEQDKQLLVKDLCMRLPYGVVIHTYYNKPIDIKCTGCDLFANTVNLDIPNDDEAKVYVENVRPYLRPMSSMTKEEFNKYMRFIKHSWEGIDKEEDNYYVKVKDRDVYIDWLLEHHFDFRGLIEKGLALEAKPGMYES